MHSLLAITTPFALFSHYYTPFELAHAIRLSKATRIFVQPQFLPLVERAAKESNFPDAHIYVFEGQAKGRQNFGRMIERVRKEFTPREAVRPASTTTLAHLIFSSGTTGLPKGIPDFYLSSKWPTSIKFLLAVMITHGNISCALLQAATLGAEISKVYTVCNSIFGRAVDLQCAVTAHIQYPGRLLRQPRFPSSSPLLRSAHVLFPPNAGPINHYFTA